MKDVFSYLNKATQMKSLRNKKDMFIQVLDVSILFILIWYYPDDCVLYAQNLRLTGLGQGLEAFKCGENALPTISACWGRGVVHIFGKFMSNPG